MKGYGILCQKMVSFPVYHFIWGHLGVFARCGREQKNLEIWKFSRLKNEVKTGLPGAGHMQPFSEKNQNLITSKHHVPFNHLGVVHKKMRSTYFIWYLVVRTLATGFLNLNSRKNVYLINSNLDISPVLLFSTLYSFILKKHLVQISFLHENWDKG